MPSGQIDKQCVDLIESLEIINGRYVRPQSIQEAESDGHHSLIFKAEDRSTRRLVTLKFCGPAALNDSYRRACFSREIAILSCFSGQPNILQLVEPEQSLQIEATAQNGYPLSLSFPYYVTEYARCNLKTYIYGGSRGPRETLHIFRQLCKAVQRINAASVIHRDLKPSNFLLVDDSVKLADFGSSRRRGEATFLRHYDLPVGDIFYSPPELYFGLGGLVRISAATDAFALGAILFELFAKEMLTPLFYERRALEDLHEMSARLAGDPEREAQYLRLLPHLKARWRLPDLEPLCPSTPRCVRGRIGVLYKRLADFDYRRRSTITFASLFRELEICLKVLDYEMRDRERRVRRRQMRKNMLADGRQSPKNISQWRGGSHV